MSSDDLSNSFNLRESTHQIKSKLWEQLQEIPDSSRFNVGKGKEISVKLQNALSLQVSTSIIVVGPQDSGKEKIIDRVVLQYECGNIARINGIQCNNDNQPLESILDQFLVRSPSKKNTSFVLKEFEDCLRAKRLQCVPAIIIIENIHEFARTTGRQTLIYTLLDLMHKEEMYLIVIGSTHCFHLHTLLEKRILSRLNSQFLYIMPNSSLSICRLLAIQLQVRGNDEEQASEQTRSGEQLISSRTEHLKQFNAAVKQLFGTFGIGEDHQVGLLYGLISCCVNWGRGYKHFVNATLGAIYRLSDEQPVFTLAGFEEAIAGQEPPTIQDALNGLPPLQLHMVAAIVRVHSQNGGTAYTSGEAIASRIEQIIRELENVLPRRRDPKTSSAASQKPGRRHVEVSLQIQEQRPLHMIISAIVELAELGLVWLSNGQRTSSGLNPYMSLDYREITVNTFLYLVPSVVVLQAAFAGKDVLGLSVMSLLREEESSEDSGKISLQDNRAETAHANIKGVRSIVKLLGSNQSVCLRPQTRVVISERVRTAVSAPLAPIAVSAPLAPITFRFVTPTSTKIWFNIRAPASNISTLYMYRKPYNIYFRRLNCQTNCQQHIYKLLTSKQ
jgi:hypothetical protein